MNFGQLNDKHIVYGLINPRTRELRYIGYTSNASERYTGHLSPSVLKRITHKNAWIKRLLQQNIKPEMILLEAHKCADALPQAEVELIAYYKFIGCSLTNGTPGGDGQSKGYQASPEARAKISAANKLAMLGNKNGAVPCSDAKKAKLSQAHMGKTLTEAQKQHLSNINKGYQRHLGFTHSHDAKRKMSEAAKGRRWKVINGKRIVFKENSY